MITIMFLILCLIILFSIFIIKMIIYKIQNDYMHSDKIDIGWYLLALILLFLLIYTMIKVILTIIYINPLNHLT